MDRIQRIESPQPHERVWSVTPVRKRDEEAERRATLEHQVVELAAASDRAAARAAEAGRAWAESEAARQAERAARSMGEPR